MSGKDIRETVGLLLVVASMVFVGLEIRQNSEATQAETRQAIIAGDAQFLQTQLENPALQLSYYAPELADEERVRLSMSLTWFVRMREGNWLQHEYGALDDVTWQAYLGSLVAVLSAPQTRAWWQNFGVERIYDADFISIVNGLLATAPLMSRSPHVSAFD